MIRAVHFLATAQMLLSGLAPSGAGESARQLARDVGGERAAQVRIEQQLIIRITPGGPGREAPPPLPPPPVAVHLRERKIGGCVPVGAILGVRPESTSRLILFTRDRRLVGADLAKSCNARDFYLGFYMSPTTDGQLCEGRDTIHSRAGATCSVLQVRELVPDN